MIQPRQWMSRRLSRRTLIPLAFALLLGTGLVIGIGRTIQAQEQNGFLTFENGRDGTIINSAIPGLIFSNTEGYNWIYGDARSHRYNAPYPESCLDRAEEVQSQTCGYAVSGNLFAWMGAVQGKGKIEFTQSSASFFEASFSTAERLTIEAYNAQGQLIASATVAENLGTGRLDRIRLEAPSGQRITSILIVGSANTWLLDNLATDAFGVPEQTPVPPQLPEQESDNIIENPGS